MSASPQQIYTDKPALQGADIRQQVIYMLNHPLDPAERLYWLKFLDNIITLPEFSIRLAEEEKAAPHALIHMVIEVCQKLCDWPLEIRLREELSEDLTKYSSRQNLALSLQNSIELICTRVKNGQYYQAYEEGRRAILCYPQNHRLTEIYHALREKLNKLCYLPEDVADKEITLVPLGEEHLEAFAWQYADPNVGILCNLPDFDSNTSWFHWLEGGLTDPTEHLFAVIHRDWGFIGSVSLRVHQGLGFFYYWLGRDFQGQGLGPRAAALLLELGARYHGMTCCYAKVYPHNEVSQLALHKIGFQRLPYSLPDKQKEEWLYYYGPPKPPAVSYAEAQKIFMAGNTDNNLIPWNLEPFYLSSE